MPPASALAPVRVAWSVTEAPNRTVIFAPLTSPELRLVVMSGLNLLMTVVSPSSPHVPATASLLAIAAVRGDPVVGPGQGDRERDAEVAVPPALIATVLVKIGASSQPGSVAL